MLLAVSVSFMPWFIERLWLEAAAAIGNGRLNCLVSVVSVLLGARLMIMRLIRLGCLTSTSDDNSCSNRLGWLTAEIISATDTLL